MTTVATHDVVTYLQKRGKKIIANQQILEQQQLRYYRELFNYLDCDGSGELEILEIIHTLKELNMKEEANTIKKTFKMMDADHSGAISFHEFLTIMTSNDVENIFGHKSISDQEKISNDDLDVGNKLSDESIENLAMEDNNTNKSLSVLIFAISYRRQNLHKIINNKQLYGMDKYKAFSQLFDVPPLPQNKANKILEQLQRRFKRKHEHFNTFREIIKGKQLTGEEYIDFIINKQQHIHHNHHHRRNYLQQQEQLYGPSSVYLNSPTTSPIHKYHINKTSKYKNNDVVHIHTNMLLPHDCTLKCGEIILPGRNHKCLQKRNVKKELNLLQKAKQDGYNSLRQNYYAQTNIDNNNNNNNYTESKNYHDIKHDVEKRMKPQRPSSLVSMKHKHMYGGRRRKMNNQHNKLTNNRLYHSRNNTSASCQQRGRRRVVYNKKQANMHKMIQSFRNIHSVKKRTDGV